MAYYGAWPAQAQISNDTLLRLPLESLLATTVDGRADDELQGVAWVTRYSLCTLTTHTLGSPYGTSSETFDLSSTHFRVSAIRCYP
ncbi:hypothetical protein EV715DRAFT_295253 [Schizophyllum commune]